MTDTENDQTVTTDDPAPSEVSAPVSAETTDTDENASDAQAVVDDASGAEASSDPFDSIQVDSGAVGDSSTDADDSDSDDDSEDDGDDDDEEDENPLETEAEIAADYLEELLDIADLDGDIDTYIEGDRAHVSIVSESDVLVGTDGHVLDALQELARLAVMTETGDRSRLMLDVAGYRDRRRTVLIGIAGDAVEEVKSSSESVALAPMNPFERKIVHDAVAAAGLTSASEGEEPRRRVVVLPAS